jgi:uncharacterized protein YjiK
MKTQLLLTKRNLENQLFDLTLNTDGEVLSKIMLKIELDFDKSKAEAIEFLEEEIFKIERKIIRL